MSATRIAGRYAKSLIDLAVERGELETVYADMTMFDEVAKNRDFIMLLRSPIVTADKKETIFNAVFGEKMSVMTMGFIKILLTKGRESYLSDIAKEVITQYKEIKKVSSVRLITATPLSPTNFAAIKARLVADNALHNDVDVLTAVDPDLIGGFVLEFNNNRYDASIASRLNDMRKEFKTNLYVDLVD
jgi:F-type H+-transporting ATPase subunit delta